MNKLFACCLFLFACTALTLAQRDGAAPFSPLETHDYDAINLMTLTPTINIPIQRKIGAIPINYTVTLSQQCVVNVPDGNYEAGHIACGNLASGYIGGLLGAGLYALATQKSCNGSLYEVYTNFAVTSSDGLDYHPLSSSLTLGTACGYATSFSNQVTIDGSGYTVSASVTGSLHATALSDSRGHTTTFSNGYAVKETDTFGNSSSLTNAVLTDSLGVATLSGISDLVPGSTLGWTDTNGRAQQIAFTAGGQLNYSTNWGDCVDNQTVGTVVPLGSIQYPDGTSIGLGYEQGPGGAGTTTGRINKITLRTGGTITYTYGPLVCGVDQPSGPVYVSSLTRTTYDGTNSYTTSYSSAGNPNNTSAGVITTVLDPGMNKTVYTFSGFNVPAGSSQAPVLTEVQVYQNTGTVGSPTYVLLSTDIYCYNTNQSNCPNANVNYPITQRDVYHTLGTGSTARTTTTLDVYGNVTSVTQYGFNSSYIFQTTTTYSGCGQGSSVHNLPCDTLEVDSAGNHVSETKYTYNSAGFKLTDSSWTGSRWITNTYAPNSNGTVATLTSPNGLVKTYGYAGCSPLLLTSTSIAVSSSDTLTSSQSWNCNGAVVTGTSDMNNNTTGTTYDPLFRVQTFTDVLGNVTTYTRTGTTTEAVTPFNGGNSVSDALTTYDGLGRDVLDQKLQAPGGSTWDTTAKYYAYSGPNRQAAITIPYQSTDRLQIGTNFTSTYLDPVGRAILSIGGSAGSAGQTINTTYQNNETTVSVGPAPTGENLKTVESVTDGLGRTTATCTILSSGGTACGSGMSGSGILTSFAYATASGTSTVTQTRGSESKSTTYDALGRTVSKTLPESGTMSYVYDAASSTCGSYSFLGKLVETVDANGAHVCYRYDLMGRLIVTTIANVGFCHNFIYGDVAQTGLTLYNVKNRIADANVDFGCTGTANVDEWFSYDPMGNITDVWEATPHTNGTYLHPQTGFYTNGTLQSLSIPNYTALATYTIDGEGRLYSSKFNSIAVSSVQYSAASKPTLITLGTGDSDSYTYDSYTGWLDNYSFSLNGQTISNTLNWNRNGSLGSLAIADGINSGGTQTCAFSYDDAARLASDNCGSIWSQAFTYDQYDNLSKSGSLSWNPGYNTLNQYSGIGASYDADGRLLYDGFNTYTWDAYGKMTSARTGNGQAVCGTSGSCFTYDAFGRPVESSSNGAYSEYLYSGVGQIAVMSGPTTVTQARIPLPGGATLLTTGANGGGSQTIENRDWLGSVRLASYYTRRTAVYDRAFAPYGETYDITGSGSPVFTGDRQDLFAGLYDTPNREMMPNQGRWLSPDPAGQGWNAYAYATDPNRSIDPTGSYSISYAAGDTSGCGEASAGCADPLDVDSGDPGDPLTPMSPSIPADPQDPRIVQPCQNDNCVQVTAPAPPEVPLISADVSMQLTVPAATKGLLFPPGARVEFQTEPNVTWKQWFHAAYDCLLSPDPLPTTELPAGDSPAESGDRLDGNSLDRSNQIYLPKPNGQQVAVTGGSSPRLNGAADAAGLELGWAGCMKQKVGGPGLWP